MIVCAVSLAGLLAVSCAKKPFFTGGDPITRGKAISIGQLMENPRAFAGERVLVQGTVSGVCKGTGCWTLVEESPSGAQIYAKSPDHSVIVPTDCEGSWIRVEGDLVVVEPSAEQAAEHEHAEGVAPHECPKPDCFVTLSAVELFKK
jgi:hypothetical protein